MRTRPGLRARAYLLGGLPAVCAAPFLSPLVQHLTLLGLGAAASGAIVTGVRRYRPNRTWPWWTLLAAVLVSQVYTAVTMFDPFPDGPFPRAGDWLYLLNFPLLVVALANFPGPNRRANRSTGAVDAAVIACTVGVLSWALLISEFLHRQRLSPSALVVALAYPIFDLFLASVVVRMAVLGGRRNPAHLMLMLSATALLAADTIYFRSFTATGPTPSGELSVAGWLAAYVLLGAAALQPAMAREGAPPGAHRASGRTRIVRYALLVVVAPAVTAATLVYTRDDDKLASVDVVVPLALTAAVGVLLVVRSGQLAAVAQRRAADLNSRTAELEAALASQAALQEQLAHRALHDALTGLPNRVLLRDRLEGAMARPGQHALLLLDLDGFKDVNDTFGHPVGDELLKVAAGRLTAVLARTDTLARLGGDEFAVLLEDVTGEQAHAVAVRIRNTVREPFAVDGHRLHVTASIGLLELAGEHGDDGDAMGDVDLALYAAKAAGKDRVVVYHDGLRADHLQRTQLVERLRQAIDHGELDLHYQPVVDLGTGAVVAAEALLRWFPAGEPPVPPDHFIPIAESSGLIMPIGAWVLRRACAQARQWYEEHGVRISVNVSAEQLRDASFPAQVEEALADSGLSARALTLEVTESMLVDPTNGDAQRAVGHLSHLRSLGVQVALDDFGTGYSSLAYLRDLPVDSLKIDRAFVPSSDNPQRIQLARAIIDLGASLDLVTVAEGVETAEQAAQLAALDCDLGQGYFFARPLPAGDLTGLLASVAPRRSLRTAAA